MIITPYSVFYSIVWGSICLIFLRLVYRFLLRHNCFKLVLFFSFLVIFRFLFVIDLPLSISSGALYSIIKVITLFGKKVFAFIPMLSSFLPSEDYWITIGKFLLIIWFGVAIVLIIRDWIAIRFVTKLSNELNKHDNNLFSEEILRKVQLELGTSYDVKLIQNSYIKIPFVRGLLHPVIYLGVSCTREELNVILQHELIHIIYHDNWIKIIIHYIKLILWWNPLIRLLFEIIEDSCEYRCDSVVTKNMDELSKLNYASLINKFSAEEVTNIRLLSFGSAYAYKKEKDFIFQRISSFLKPQALKLSTKFIYLVTITIIIVGTLLFSFPTVMQESYLSSVEENMEITAENSYLLKNSDGRYSLYNFGMLIDDDITDISNYNLPVEEEKK